MHLNKFVYVEHKKGNKWCFKIPWFLSPKFIKYFTWASIETFTFQHDILGALNPYGNNVGNMHSSRFGLLYSLTILDPWVNDRYCCLFELHITLDINFLLQISFPSKSTSLEFSIKGLSFSNSFFDSFSIVYLCKSTLYLFNVHYLLMQHL